LILIEIRHIRNLIVDMDGVLWHGNRPLPGLQDFFTVLRQRGIRFVAATNNAGRTGVEYVTKFASMGVSVTADEILTSPQATAQFLAQHAPEARIYVVGSPSLAMELRAKQLVVVAPEAAQTADCVVVGGIVGHITYDDLAEACLLIRKGARFIGTNPDVTFPGERGIVPGNGAILEALRVSTDVAPTVIGKPQPEMMKQAMARMGGSPADTAVIGDRLDTDILGGQNAGLTSLLVLTGVTTAEQAQTDPIRADYVYETLVDVAQALAG
jgi:4-nitrophenyl phosphatase